MFSVFKNPVPLLDGRGMTGYRLLLHKYVVMKTEKCRVCTEALCFLFWYFPHSVTPFFKHRVATSFLPGCCWLAVFLLKTAGKQQQSSKPIRIWKEPGIASMDHFMVKKIIREQKNILQRLCTNSAFSLLHDPIFVISTEARHRRWLAAKKNILIRLSNTCTDRCW
jgi:hypothetical protein